jgi:Spy/CpxP family protein refolding chaperone
MRIIGAVLVALLLAGTSSLSYAQPPAKPAKSDKTQEWLEIVTMWKMMEALDLDKATAEKILEIRHKYLGKRKDLHSSLTQDLKALKQRLAEATAADDKELARLLSDIRDKRKKLMELWDLQYDEVSKILTTKQQAELVIFLKESRKELESILAPGGVPAERPGPPNHNRSPYGPPPMPPPRPPGPHESNSLGPDD